MEPTCYLNGEFIALGTAAIPVGDLGVQRGYGIFDFIRVTNDVPLYIDDHLARFSNSADKMRLPIGKTTEELKGIIHQLLQMNNLPDSGLRILLTGGVSQDGYQIVQPNLAIIQSSLAAPPSQLSKPYKLVTYSHSREMPHIKTTNYLMAVWLQPWVKEKQADDVLYHQQGMLSECPRSNFFMVTQDDTIVTSARNILKGITRKQIFRIAAEKGIRIEERDIYLEELASAKEAFISSSTKRIIPVRQIDEYRYTSDNPMAEKLFQLLMEREEAVMQQQWFQ